jgi:hypothetical protein
VPTLFGGIKNRNNTSERVVRVQKPFDKNAESKREVQETTREEGVGRFCRILNLLSRTLTLVCMCVSVCVCVCVCGWVVVC